MIDIHSHILPAIDDGSKSIEETLEMLKLTKLDGIKNIVATPHYYRGYYENSYKDIAKLVGEINNIASEKHIDIKIISGQEVFIDNHTLELYREGIIACIEGTNYMLIELPMDSMPKDALDTIYELRIQGIKPIIAHPERYKYIIDKPSTLNAFIDEGCLFQLNSGSIKGIFGKTVKKTSELLIEQGACNFIASDTHSTGRRCPGVSDAIEVAKSLNKSLVQHIMDNEKKFLNNEDIKLNAEKIKEKRSFFSFLKR